MQKIFQYKKAIPLFLLLCGCMAGCAFWKIGAEHNVVKNGILFETFNEDSNGKKQGTMAEDTVIDGWPCMREFVVFHPDWRLDELYLSRDYERNGIFMPAKTRVFVNEEGNPGICCFPYDDVEIQGFLCRGKGYGYMTWFYPSGKLEGFYTRDSVVIDGVKGKGWIRLHENGRLKQCILTEPYRIEGEDFPNGVTCKEDGPVFFHENGRLYGCMLNESFRIEGEEFLKGDMFFLDPEGNVTDSIIGPEGNVIKVR